MTLFWENTGDKVVVGKAVVSPTGHVVAKNYDRRKLRSGDIGLEVRIDRGDTKGELNPSQATATQDVAAQLSQFLLGQTGHNPAGFVPGDIVQTSTGELAMVDHDSGDILRLRMFDDNGTLFRTTRSLHSTIVEERPGYRGLSGLVEAFFEKEGYVFPGFTKCCVDEKLLLRVLDELGEHTTSREAIRDEITRVFLAKDSPFDYAPVLERLVKAGERRLIFEYAKSSTDPRRFDVLPHLLKWVTDAEQADTILSMIPVERQDLLRDVVCKHENPIIMLAATKRLTEPDPGLLEALYKLLECAIQQSDYLDFDDSLDIFELLDKQEGSQVVIEPFRMYGFEGGWGDQASTGWQLKIKAHGGAVDRMIPLGMWEQQLPFLGNRELIEGLCSLKLMEEVSEAFWRHMEFGFDFQSDDPEQIRWCCFENLPVEVCVWIKEHTLAFPWKEQEGVSNKRIEEALLKVDSLIRQQTKELRGTRAEDS